MIAYRGMDCKKCEAFLAAGENNNKLGVEVAEKWAGNMRQALNLNKSTAQVASPRESIPVGSDF